MTRLGSEFLKALDSYERPVFGYITFRQLVLLFGIGLTVLVTSVLFWFQTPDIILYGVSLLVLAPFVIFGCHIDEKIKDEMRFLNQPLRTGSVSWRSNQKKWLKL